MLTGACGMKCDECPIFRAVKEWSFMKSFSRPWLYHGDVGSHAEFLSCAGCSAPDEMFWGSGCKLRDCCVKEKKLENCSLCEDFACCKLVKEFEEDGIPAHRRAVAYLKELYEAQA